MRRINKDFWNGKRVFLTGHTGFKGSWLSLWLNSIGAVLKGYALDPPTKPSLFNIANVGEGIESQIADIRDFDTLKKSMFDFDPDIVIHMAAQPLVRLSYVEPLDTYDINVMGTANVLQAARICPNLKSIVAITTDKCYENREWEWGYREIEPMGGSDPYSSSKGCSELIISAYQRSFFNNNSSASLASARAGNVVGGGDWATDRLIPDALRAFENGNDVLVRNPKAIRPWQHVLEPLSGYLILSETLYTEGKSFAEPWNFGPKDEDCKSVEWVLNKIVDIWPREVSWSLDQNANPHEAQFLKLDCSKASNRLNWHPLWDINMTMERIVDWHTAWKEGSDMRQYCLDEIDMYNS